MGDLISASSELSAGTLKGGAKSEKGNVESQMENAELKKGESPTKEKQSDLEMVTDVKFFKKNRPLDKQEEGSTKINVKDAGVDVPLLKANQVGDLHASSLTDACHRKAIISASPTRKERYNFCMEVFTNKV